MSSKRQGLREVKPVDYATLDNVGLMDNGKIPYEGLAMAEGGVPFLKKEGSKTTPRPTKASLPSPPLSSAMEALNKKVEQLMAENKRLEKAIFGPPTEPAKARKPAKQKSVEGARAMNLEDLRAMGGVQRMAERDMERYGAMDQSSDSDSNTERDDSDGSADKDRRRKGKHSKAKLKSGKTAKITSRVVNPQVWPHSELSLSYVTKNVRYDELTMEEFVAGYSSILSRPRISPVEKEARITHLTRLMYLAIQYEWGAVRDFHAAVLLEIERGFLVWGDSLARVEQHALIGRWKPPPASRKIQITSTATLFCRDFNHGRCQQEKDHYGMIKGVRKWLQHICAKCLTANKAVVRHAEQSSECPLHSDKGSLNSGNPQASPSA